MSATDFLVLDIETLPLLSALNAPYPSQDRLPPANYKNADAIAGWREKDEAAWREQRIKECSLTPRLGRVACLGWAVDDDYPGTREAPGESDEHTLIDCFWNLVPKANRIVTFNGAFDLRFLVVRSAILGITPCLSSGVGHWFQRYRTLPHFDTRAVLTGWDDRQTGKLNEWCAAFGIECEDTTSGADVYGLAQRGEWDAIAAHCRSDVEQTRKLYWRTAPLFV